MDDRYIDKNIKVVEEKKELPPFTQSSLEWYKTLTDGRKKI